jgi:hypothetical protein
MKAQHLVLIAAVLLTALALACGDDDDGGPGEPADVQGIWTGTYASDSTDRGGELCLDLGQLNTAVAGTAYFAGEPPLSIGGLGADEQLSFVWSATGASSGQSPTPTLEPSPPPTPIPPFKAGGSFEGDLEGDMVSGTWTSVDGDSGTWSAMRDATLEACTPPSATPAASGQ